MTWTLIGRSFAVLWTDKRLIVFPLLSGSVAAIGAAYLFATFSSEPITGFRHLNPSDPWSYAILFLLYCLGSFAILFFNCALAACAQVRFAGGEPSLTEGMRRAAERAGAILFWSLISSTVGLVLRIVAQRAGWAAKIATSIFGLGWGMATYLMVPVLVLEDQDVFSSVRRSGALLRKTWGEQIRYGLTFGWLTLLLLVPVFVLGAMAMNYYPWMLPFAVLCALLLAAAMTAARGVFVVALYQYATSGKAPDGYPPDSMSGVFGRRL